jgi:hypothetical protein
LSYPVPVNLLSHDVEAERRNLKHRARVEQKVGVEEGLVGRDCGDGADVCNYSQIMQGRNQV